jgi:hypothetical protein
MKEKTLIKILQDISRELEDIAPTIDSKKNPTTWSKLLNISFLISVLLDEIQ